jgi:murein biosynthesis integral membrane protein MurJ
MLSVQVRLADSADGLKVEPSMAYRFIDERDGTAWVKSADRGPSGLIARIYRSSTQRVISLTFIGLALGFLVDVLIAAKLGTGQTADALVIALTLPILIDTVFRQGTRHSMVPLFVEANSSLGEVEFQRFVSGLLNLGCGLGLIIVGLLEAFAPWVVMGLAPGLTPASKAESTLLLRLCAPLIFFTIGCTVMGVYLNSRKRFNPVALRNVLTPGVILCVILLFWQSGHVAASVAAAYTIGFAGFFCTLFMDLRRTGHRHVWLAWTTREDLSRLKSAAFLITLGFLLRNCLRILERFLASLVAVGGISSYYFAYRLVSALQALIGGSIATTALPGMTEHDIRGDKARLARSLRRNISRTLLLSLPLFLLIVVFHHRLISFVYGRGNFGAESIQVTSQILFWLGFGLVFWCLAPVFQSGLYAQRAYHLIFRNMIMVIIVNVGLAVVLSQLWGLVGIAIATTLSTGYAIIHMVHLLRTTGVHLFKAPDKETA